MHNHPGPIHALTYSSGAGQYLLSGSSDRSVNLYNPSTAASSSSTSSQKTTPPTTAGLIRSYTGAHTHSVLALAVATDNATFASGSADRSLAIWDVGAGHTVRRFTGHAGAVQSVAWAGEGDGVLVSGSFDASVRLWDVKARGSSRAVMVLDEARDGVGAVVVHGWEVLAGGTDGRVRAYDVRMGRCVVDVFAGALGWLLRRRGQGRG